MSGRVNLRFFAALQEATKFSSGKYYKPYYTLGKL